MSWNEPDVYNSPSAFGLEILGTVQWTEQSYDYDMTIVLRSETATGTLYWADDSGCSCPSPFEYCTSLDKLETGTLADLEAHLNDRLATAVKTDWDDPWADVADILRKAANPIGTQ